MAAVVEFQEDNGAATGAPAKGTTRTTARTEVNWKNIDDSTTVYTANPIAAGSNSYQKPQFLKFTSGYNQIANGLFAHTSTAFGTGLTLKGPAAVSSDGTRWLYTTPSTSADSNLTTDMTSAISIGSGVAVWFGATGPEATGKAAAMTTVPCYSTYFPTQLQTSGSAASGDSASVTLTAQWDES